MWISLVAGAVLTPSVDVISMFLTAVPFLIVSFYCYLFGYRRGQKDRTHRVAVAVFGVLSFVAAVFLSLVVAGFLSSNVVGLIRSPPPDAIFCLPLGAAAVFILAFGCYLFGNRRGEKDRTEAMPGSRRP